VVELRVLRHQNRVARVDAGVEARRACNHMQCGLWLWPNVPRL
jgi:hypothetical protein